MPRDFKIIRAHGKEARYRFLETYKGWFVYELERGDVELFEMYYADSPELSQASKAERTLEGLHWSIDRSTNVIITKKMKLPSGKMMSADDLMRLVTNAFMLYIGSHRRADSQPDQHYTLNECVSSAFHQGDTYSTTMADATQADFDYLKDIVKQYTTMMLDYTMPAYKRAYKITESAIFRVLET